MRLTILLSGLAIALAAALAVWFFMTFERVVIEVPAAFEGEARYNDFLAAEILLRYSGIEADARATLTPSNWLPSTEDTLVVRASPLLAAANERSILLDWVANGGYLILAAPPETTVLLDTLFDEFDMRLVALEAGTVPDESVVESPVGSTPGYRIEGSRARFRLEPDGDGEALDGVRDEHGAFVLRSAYGSGYVAAVADADVFGNLALPSADHARLLLDTVAGLVPPGAVWFIYDVSFTPLWRLIWEHLSYFVVGSAALIVLWLWSVVPRFGRMTAPTTAWRRSITEHVRAAARFGWQHEGAGALVADAADAIIRRAERREPGLARRPQADRDAALARLTGVPAAEISAALSPAPALRPREFIHRIQTLQALRNHL